MEGLLINELFFSEGLYKSEMELQKVLFIYTLSNKGLTGDKRNCTIFLQNIKDLKVLIDLVIVFSHSQSKGQVMDL